MPLNAILEFSLCFDTFRNIDLSQQGLYCVRASVLHNGSPAHPYNQVLLQPKLLGELHNLAPPQLQDAFSYTKVFGVRFYEEIVDLKEVVYFRAEVACEPVPAVLSVVFELLHSELDCSADVSTSDLNLGILARVEYTLPFPHSFQATFIPVTFGPQHYSLVNCFMHYILIEYKFASTAKTHDVGTAAAYALFTRKHKLRRFVGAAETDEIHSRITRRLSTSYTNMRSHYLRIATRFLTQDHRMNSNLAYTPPPLCMPGCATQSPYASLRRSTCLSEANSGNIERFSSRVACHDAVKVATALLYELSAYSSQVLQLWHRFSEVVHTIPKQVRFLLQDEFRVQSKATFADCIVSKISPVTRLGSTPPTHSVEELKSLAAAARQQNPSKTPQCVTRPPLDATTQPIIIEELTIQAEAMHAYSNELAALSKKRTAKSSHLFVFAHGYQGNANDLRMFKNRVSTINPNGYFLVSKANENCTDESIELLGYKLAAEVLAYVSEYFQDQTPEKISFIGHSLGGLIVRAALPHLRLFSAKMHLLLTFGTPHLGIRQNESRLVNVGVWVMQALSDSLCLRQLGLSDGPENFLSRLSKAEGFEWFQHVVLMSSPQDKYVPHESARIEVQDHHDKLIADMAENLLKKRKRVHRMSVDFQNLGNGIDSLIGRAAHVQLLEDEVVMETLLYLHPEFFY